MHFRFGFLCYEISHVIRQRFNQKAEALGLTHSQWRVLVHLSENPNCRQVDLAEILAVKPITLVKQLDQLEALALVRRIKDSGDRRAYRLELTEQALPVMQALWDIADKVEAEVFGVLTSAEQALVTLLLCRVKSGLSDSES
ncbi:MAG: MarR family transcriptional regulator [Gammaproteobacteria bacterium HGW-Gammaproteobacteria-10]|nr:MAG: MarR family transcriptional regulator [Gammaproteobacteria bacterium HGW-Gammaproteobacteria-10]